MDTGSNKVSRYNEQEQEQEFTGPNMRFINVIGETTEDVVSYDDQIFFR